MNLRPTAFPILLLLTPLAVLAQAKEYVPFKTGTLASFQMTSDQPAEDGKLTATLELGAACNDRTMLGHHYRTKPDFDQPVAVPAGRLLILSTRYGVEKPERRFCRSKPRRHAFRSEEGKTYRLRHTIRPDLDTSLDTVDGFMPGCVFKIEELVGTEWVPVQDPCNAISPEIPAKK
jgi:hypothetical protein